MLSPMIGDIVHPDETQSAAGRSRARCAWLLLTVHWPGWQVHPHLSGACASTLPQPPRPLGE